MVSLGQSATREVRSSDGRATVGWLSLNRVEVMGEETEREGKGG